jgi:acyl-coenzyme A synthetase/AMP-(fatty) acid ligase
MPKGVIHTHGSLLAATDSMYSLGLDGGQTLLAVTQLVHIAALSCVLLSGIANGASIVILPTFNAGKH